MAQIFGQAENFTKLITSIALVGAKLSKVDWELILEVEAAPYQ